MNSKKYKLFFIFFLIYFLTTGFLFPQISQAQLIKFIPQIGVGNEFPAGKEVEVSGFTFANYIVAFYTWSIRAIAVLAVIMIMVAGFRWLTSAGNAPAISQAKNQMISAIIGLVLAIGANLFLYSINPALTRFKNLNITSIIAIQDIAACPSGKGWSGVSSNEGFQRCVKYCMEEMGLEINTNMSGPIIGTDYYCCGCGKKLLTECEPGDTKINYIRYDHFTGCCKHCFKNNQQVDKCYPIDTKAGDLGIDFTCVKCVPIVQSPQGCLIENKIWGRAKIVSTCAYLIGNNTVCKRHSSTDYSCEKKDDQCEPKYIGPNAQTFCEAETQDENCPMYSNNSGNCLYVGGKCTWFAIGKEACEEENNPSYCEYHAPPNNKRLCITVVGWPSICMWNI